MHCPEEGRKMTQERKMRENKYKTNTNSQKTE
jgi:hypothetical protein